MKSHCELQMQASILDLVYLATNTRLVLRTNEINRATAALIET